MADIMTSEDTSPDKNLRPNDRVRHYNTFEQMQNHALDYDSDNFIEACDNLGIHPNECKIKRK